MDENAISLFIGVPSCRDWKAAFGSSTDALTFHLYEHGIGKGKVKKIYKKYFSGASCLPQSRQLILSEACSLDAEGNPNYTHLLSIDDDQVFPPDVVSRMLAANKPVVAANYCRKIQGEVKGTALGMDGQHMDSSCKEGLEEALYIGMGLCLIKLDAIRHIPRPHFEVLWDESRGDYWGEDMYFCDRLRQYGVPIYVDHDLSKVVGHVGDYVYQFATPSGVQAIRPGTPINQPAFAPTKADAEKLSAMFGESMREAAE